MPTSLLFFIPVAMSVGWTQWHSKCNSLTASKENCRKQTPASQWLSWEIQVLMVIVGCSFLFQPAAPRCLQHSLECVSLLLNHLTLFLLFLSSDSHTWKLQVVHGTEGMFIFVCPQQINMKWFTEALKIIGYQIVHFFLYCKRVIFIWYFIFLFHVAGTLEKKIKSTTYPIIILGI